MLFDVFIFVYRIALRKLIRHGDDLDLARMVSMWWTEDRAWHDDVEWPLISKKWRQMKMTTADEYTKWSSIAPSEVQQKTAEKSNRAAAPA